MLQTQDKTSLRSMLSPNSIDRLEKHQRVIQIRRKGEYQKIHYFSIWSSPCTWPSQWRNSKCYCSLSPSSPSPAALLWTSSTGGWLSTSLSVVASSLAVGRDVDRRLTCHIKEHSEKKPFPFEDTTVYYSIFMPCEISFAQLKFYLFSDRST